VLLAPGIRLIESGPGRGTPSAGAKPKVRWGLLIDTTKCADRLHRLRHRLQHRKRPGPTAADRRAQWIRKVEIKEIKTGRRPRCR
jgi:tetrathionate reductase subunit B